MVGMMEVVADSVMRMVDDLQVQVDSMMVDVDCDMDDDYDGVEDDDGNNGLAVVEVMEDRYYKEEEWMQQAGVVNLPFHKTSSPQIQDLVDRDLVVVVEVVHQSLVQYHCDSIYKQ